MEKHAVYSGTRNLYADMVTAAKSLIDNSTVTDVWLLIEDDEFPYELPDIVSWHTKDMSGQTWFPPGSPNMDSPFTYMAMVRAVYPEIFPDLDRIVSFDCDTICIDDVDYLWEMDLHGNWIAATEELLGTYKPYGKRYYNVGVTVYDLAKMREDGASEKLVRLMNKRKLWCVEQDALNRYHKVEPLFLRFNESAVTGYTDNPAIVHYASFGTDWADNEAAPRREYAVRYRRMPWDEVRRG